MSIELTFVTKLQIKITQFIINAHHIYLFIIANQAHRLTAIPKMKTKSYKNAAKSLVNQDSNIF